MPLPFRQSATGTGLYSPSPAAAAELKLAYALDEGLDAAVLVGAPGLGKTAVLRRLAARARADGHTVVDVFFPHLDVDELLAAINAEIAGELPAAETRQIRLRRIAQHCGCLAGESRGIVILIDDAHLIRDALVFEAIQSLLNLRERDGARLTVVFAGQHTLLSHFAATASLGQRIAVTAALAPLSMVETANYIHHRLRSVGHEESLFEEPALSAAYECTNGVPRVIDRTCEMAMIVAAAGRRARVTAADIQAVAPELRAPDCQAA